MSTVQRDEGSRKEGQGLTEAEVRMVQQIAEGVHIKDIAKFEKVTTESIRQRLLKVYDKLNASNKAHAVAVALREGIIR